MFAAQLPRTVNIALFIFILVVLSPSIIVPPIVHHQNKHAHYDVAMTTLQAAARAMSTRVQASFGAAKAAEGLVLTTNRVVANVSAPASARRVFIDKFVPVMEQIQQRNDLIFVGSSVSINPGGVVGDMWPPNSTDPSFDAFAIPGIAEGVIVLANIGQPSYNTLVFPSAERPLQLSVYIIPIYADPTGPRKFTNFWGQIISLSSMEFLFQGVKAQLGHKYDFAISFKDGNATKDVLIYGSHQAVFDKFSTDARQREFGSVRESGSTVYYNIYIDSDFVSPIWDFPWAIAVVVAGYVCGVFLLVILINTAVWCARSEYNGWKNAPRSIGPFGGQPPGVPIAILRMNGLDRLFERFPDIATEMESSFYSTVETATRRFSSYMVPKSSSRSVTIVAKEINDVVNVCSFVMNAAHEAAKRFSVADDLDESETSQLDAKTAHLSFGVTAVLQWCTEATIITCDAGIVSHNGQKPRADAQQEWLRYNDDLTGSVATVNWVAFDGIEVDIAQDLAHRALFPGCIAVLPKAQDVLLHVTAKKKKQKQFHIDEHRNCFIPLAGATAEIDVNSTNAHPSVSKSRVQTDAFGGSPSDPRSWVDLFAVVDSRYPVLATVAKNSLLKEQRGLLIPYTHIRYIPECKGLVLGDLKVTDTLVPYYFTNTAGKVSIPSLNPLDPLKGNKPLSRQGTLKEHTIFQSKKNPQEKAQSPRRGGSGGDIIPRQTFLRSRSTTSSSVSETMRAPPPASEDDPLSMPREADVLPMPNVVRASSECQDSDSDGGSYSSPASHSSQRITHHQSRLLAITSLDIKPHTRECLEESFKTQAFFDNISFNKCLPVVYVFLLGIRTILEGLAPAERQNVLSRLIAAFGVPKQNTLEHVAVRCALIFLGNCELDDELIANNSAHESSSASATPRAIVHS